jgi:Fic family protein
MADLFTLMNYQQDSALETPLLMRVAIVHAQFESIHPFLDGNGRTGRMLIPLNVCSAAGLRSWIAQVCAGIPLPEKLRACFWGAQY